MNWSANDYSYMNRALYLARKGIYSTHPNPRVGCILVKSGRIISEGWHEFSGGPHAEINAINNSAEPVDGSTCYVTLEPCSHVGKTGPCADALIEASISKVIIAMQDPNPEVSGTGIKKLKQAGITVELGLYEQQARRLNRGYIKRRTKHRPYVRCKLAMSIDARTAMANGESKWITGGAARKDVHKYRAMSSVVMTGINTVLNDDPSLNVRDFNHTQGQPLRVVLDRSLQFPVSSKMLSQEGRTLIFTENTETELSDTLQESGAEVIVINVSNDDFLEQVMGILADKEEVNEIFLESGASLAGAMIERSLVDEIILYEATILMGAQAKSLFLLPGIESLKDKIELKLEDTRYFDTDTRRIFSINSKN